MLVALSDINCQTEIKIRHVSVAMSFVDGVLNGVELELVHNFFISCSIAEISSWAEVQYADVELQPKISQQ